MGTLHKARKRGVKQIPKALGDAHKVRSARTAKILAFLNLKNRWLIGYESKAHMMPLEMIRIDRSSIRGRYFPNLVMIKCFLVFYWVLYLIFPDGHGNLSTKARKRGVKQIPKALGDAHRERSTRTAKILAFLNLKNLWLIEYESKAHVMPLEMIRIDRSSIRGHYFPNLVMIKCFLVFH